MKIVRVVEFLEGQRTMPRITRSFCERLIELLDELETPLSEARSFAEDWLNLQDEESKTAEIREEIGEARESLEMALEDLDCVKELAELLGLSKR